MCAVLINPSFIYGAHERVFSSVLVGAVCLSDENRYLADNFNNEEDIVFFDLRNCCESGRIAKFPEDCPTLQAIADRGKAIAMENHTWFNRGRQILHAVDLHNANRARC